MWVPYQSVCLTETDWFIYPIARWSPTYVWAIHEFKADKVTEQNCQDYPVSVHFRRDIYRDGSTTPYFTQDGIFGGNPNSFGGTTCFQNIYGVGAQIPNVLPGDRYELRITGVTGPGAYMYRWDRNPSVDIAHPSGMGVVSVDALWDWEDYAPVVYASRSRWSGSVTASLQIRLLRGETVIHNMLETAVLGESHNSRRYLPLLIQRDSVAGDVLEVRLLAVNGGSYTWSPNPVTAIKPFNPNEN
jgi:hypothetical protein